MGTTGEDGHDGARGEAGRRCEGGERRCTIPTALLRYLQVGLSPQSFLKKTSSQSSLDFGRVQKRVSASAFLRVVDSVPGALPAIAAAHPQRRSTGGSFPPFGFSETSWGLLLSFLLICGVVAAIVYLFGFFLFSFFKRIYRPGAEGFYLPTATKVAIIFLPTLSLSNTSFLSWGKKQFRCHYH